MADEASGASRRDVLRGSAIGMGALVGAMAMTNSNEVDAEAAGTSNHTYYLVLAGINTSSSRIRINSFGAGGENDGGALMVDQIPISMPTGNFSYQLLRHFAEKLAITSATIRGYQQDTTGKTVNSLKIVLNNVRIVRYHVGAGSGGPTDNISLNVGTSVELDWVLTNKSYTWVIPA